VARIRHPAPGSRAVAVLLVLVLVQETLAAGRLAVRRPPTNSALRSITGSMSRWWPSIIASSTSRMN
jgi:hypothetical protein